MPVIDCHRGTVGPYKPDLSGNCPAELAKARDQLRKAKAALGVLRWELVQIGELQLASTAARALDELAGA